MRVAVYADGPDSILVRPIVRWSEKTETHQGITGFVQDQHSREIPAKELPGFAVIVHEHELGDPDVYRIAAAAWRGRDDDAVD